MSGGRPSEYKQEYCEQVIEHGKAGKSVAWSAAEFDVNKDTIYEWMKVHPEFSDAITRSRAHAQRWWEDAGQDNMLLAQGQGSFNASVWSRSMAARFPDDWRENKGVEVSGGLKVTSAAELTDDQLAAIATGSGG